MTTGSGQLSFLRALALPLHAAPLLLVTVFSILGTLSVHAGLLGLPMLLIIGSWFFKYAFLLLDHVAQGRPGAPVLAMEDANPLGEVRPLAYGLTILAYYAATAALASLVGAAASSGLRLLGLAALPAVIATSVVTGSFVRSLSPAVVAGVVRGLGPAYLVALAVAAACWWLGSAIAFDGARFGLLLQSALLMILWLAMFSVLGGIIHARRFELGFEPEHSPERRRDRENAERDRLRDRLIDQVFAEYRSGSTQNAMRTIRRHVEQSGTPAEEYGWIHERLAAWPNPRLANAVATEMVPLLLAAQRNGDALRVVKARLQADPAFRPGSGEQAVRLAELARLAGDRALARRLLADFEARFPDDAARTRARRLGEELDGR